MPAEAVFVILFHLVICLYKLCYFLLICFTVLQLACIFGTVVGCFIIYWNQWSNVYSWKVAYLLASFLLLYNVLVLNYDCMAFRSKEQCKTLKGSTMQDTERNNARHWKKTKCKTLKGNCNARHWKETVQATERKHNTRHWKNCNAGHWKETQCKTLKGNSFMTVQ